MHLSAIAKKAISLDSIVGLKQFCTCGIKDTWALPKTSHLEGMRKIQPKLIPHPQSQANTVPHAQSMDQFWGEVRHVWFKRKTVGTFLRGGILKSTNFLATTWFRKKS